MHANACKSVDIYLGIWDRKWQSKVFYTKLGGMWLRNKHGFLRDISPCRPRRCPRRSKCNSLRLPHSFLHYYDGFSPWRDSTFTSHLPTKIRPIRSGRQNTHSQFYNPWKTISFTIKLLNSTTKDEPYHPHMSLRSAMFYAQWILLHTTLESMNSPIKTPVFSLNNKISYVNFWVFT